MVAVEDDAEDDRDERRRGDRVPEVAAEEGGKKADCGSDICFIKLGLV